MNIHFSKNIAAMLLCLLYALNGFCGDKPVKPITGTWINPVSYTHLTLPTIA